MKSEDLSVKQQADIISLTMQMSNCTREQAEKELQRIIRQRQPKKRGHFTRVNYEEKYWIFRVF